MENLGIRLKKIREEKGLNQRDFAKKIGISQGMLSGIENGTEKFSIRTQKIVCFEFGVNEGWLLTGKGDIFTSKSLQPVVTDSNERVLTSDTYELIELYDKLLPETQEEIFDYIRDKLELQEKKAEAESRNTAVGLPLESLPASGYEEDRFVG